jgi:hypothetical protein
MASELDRQPGVALCFCRQRFDADPFSITGIDFDKERQLMRARGELPPRGPTKIEASIPRYCDEWFQEYT